MNWFQQILDALRSLFQWWFIVLPWEQSVRIRMGKRVQQFDGGLHFKIPFLDRVYIQNIRLRISMLTPQTLTTQDGKTITCAGSVRYRIKDIRKLYETLHQAEGTIKQHVEGLLAEYVVNHDLAKCSPKIVSEHVTERLDLSEYGLNDTEFFLTDFAVVRTIRLIGGDMQRWVDGPIETNYVAQQMMAGNAPR